MAIKTAEQVLAEAKSQIKEYTPAEVQAMLKRGDKINLLDVRDLPEVNLGKIPGAIHISRGRLEQNIEAAVPRSANLVIYCANGNRSALAAVSLRDMGYEHVSSMSAGINGWTAAGGEIRVTPGDGGPLDAILARPEIRRLAAALRDRPGKTIPPQGAERYAAIAVIFRAGASGEPELLMIKRAAHDTDPWSGHVACPGGRAEPRDRDLEETAVRETWEETGVDIRTRGQVLGTLDDLAPRISALPPLVIRPYVAIVDSAVTIVANPEVADAFWVPLSALKERAQWGLGLVDIRGESREVDVFRHNEYTVWGLTERVLKNLMERIAG